MRISPLLALTFSIGTLVGPAHSAEPLPRANLVVSQKAFALESDPELTCDGTVNGYITLPQRASGAHRLEGIWIRPDGEAQERSAVTVDFPAPGRQTAQVWLQFKSGGVLSSFQDEEPAGPLFNGEWTLLVRWDEKELIQTKFKVRC